jgi:hypothetical protein
MALTDMSFHFAFLQILVDVNPQDSPTGQGEGESSWGIECRYVNVCFYPFRTAEMALTDMSFHFAFFQILVDVNPQDSPTGQGEGESSWGIECRYVNVCFYPSRTAEMALTDMSFHFAFFQILVDVNPQDSPTRQGNLESRLGID